MNDSQTGSATPLAKAILLLPLCFPLLLIATGCAIRPLLMGTTAVSLLAGLVILVPGIRDFAAFSWQSRIGKTGLALACGFLLLALLECLLPVAAKDELSHHLALPRLWLEKGSLRPLTGIAVSYFPAWTEVLYAGALGFNSETAARLTHFLLGVTLMLAPWLTHAGRKYPAGSFFVALLWLLTPAVFDVFSLAYSDLGAVLFIFVGLLYWNDWLEEEKSRDLCLSSAWLGMAAAVKYSAFPIGAVIISLSVIRIFRMRISGSPRAYHALPLLLFFFAAPAAHFIQNYVASGNPVYPLLHGLFAESGGRSGVPVSHWTIRRMFYGEPLALQLLAPLRVFFTGLAGDGRSFDGVLNPLWLCWPLPVLWGKKRNLSEAEKYLLAAWGLSTIITLLSASPRARYYLPSLAPLAVLILGRTDQIEWTPLRKRAAIALCSISAAFALFHAGYTARQRDLVPYLTGALTREEYLSRHVPEYSIVQQLNRQLAADAVIYIPLLGNRFYYIERKVVMDDSFLPDRLIQAADSARDANTLRQNLLDEGITHILYPAKSLREVLEGQLPREHFAIAAGFFAEMCPVIEKDRIFIACEIVSPKQG